jgi:hypothetical protein
MKDKPDVLPTKKNISVITKPIASIGNPIVAQLILGLDGTGGGGINSTLYSLMLV